METYIQKLQEDIRENKILLGEDSPQPCLDALWWHYCECHNLDSEAAKERIRSLRSQLEILPFRERDDVFTGIFCLCAEHERLAFHAGLRLGAQLMLELKT